VWHASHFGALIQTYKHLDDLAGGALPPGSPTTIDLQSVWGQGLPLADMNSTQQAGGAPACPPSFSAVDVDLNHGAGGAYSYLCTLRATAAAGGGPLLLNALVATAPAGGAPPACPPGGWQPRGGNLKAGTHSQLAELLCVLLGTPAAGGTVVAGVAVAQGAGAKCPSGYAAASEDLSGGVGEFEVLCLFFADAAEALARLRGEPTARLPARFGFSAERPADKRARAVLPPRRKPLEARAEEL
jgi:hypothetical protein